MKNISAIESHKIGIIKTFILFFHLLTKAVVLGDWDCVQNMCFKKANKEEEEENSQTSAKLFEKKNKTRGKIDGNTKKKEKENVSRK